MKQKRNQLEAVPPGLAGAPTGLGALEKKPVSMQSMQTFELPDTERVDRDAALDKGVWGVAPGDAANAEEERRKHSGRWRAPARRAV